MSKLYRLLRLRKIMGSKVGGTWLITDEAICKLLEDGMNVKK
jgi:hypothetical protein